MFKQRRCHSCIYSLHVLPHGHCWNWYVQLCPTTTEKVSYLQVQSFWLLGDTHLKFVPFCSNLRQNIHNEQTLKAGKSPENKTNVKHPWTLERNVGPIHHDDRTLILVAGDKALTSQRMNIEIPLTSWCKQDLSRTTWELSEYCWSVLCYLITHPRSIKWNVRYDRVPSRLIVQEKILSKDNKSYECLEKKPAA